MHLPSIDDDGDQAAARDARDAQMCENLKHAAASKQKKKQHSENTSSEENTPQPTPRKFPNTQQGWELRRIACNIDTIIPRIESALYRADIHMLRLHFDTLLQLETDLRSKSAEYDIHTSSMDKRYDRISKTKELWLKVFDFFVDKEKRQSYLASLSENDFTKHDNIIINNFEIIDRITAAFKRIDNLSYTIDRTEIKELCDTILTDLIPQLKGATSLLKRDFRTDAEEILLTLSRPVQSLNSHYSSLILTIIDYLEKAHIAYNDKDLGNCKSLLKRAETLLPDLYGEVERSLYDQILHLRELLGTPHAISEESSV